MSMPIDNSVATGTGVVSGTPYVKVYDVSKADKASFQCVTSGASAASLTIAQSNDNINYVTISSQTVTISASTSLTSLLYAPAVPATKYIKITLTVTTGTGAITITDFLLNSSQVWS